MDGETPEGKLYDLHGSQPKFVDGFVPSTVNLYNEFNCFSCSCLAVLNSAVIFHATSTVENRLITLMFGNQVVLSLTCFWLTIGLPGLCSCTRIIFRQYHKDTKHHKSQTAVTPLAEVVLGQLIGATQLVLVVPISFSVGKALRSSSLPVTENFTASASKPKRLTWSGVGINMWR